MMVFSSFLRITLCTLDFCFLNFVFQMSNQYLELFYNTMLFRKHKINSKFISISNRAYSIYFVDILNQCFLFW